MECGKKVETLIVNGKTIYPHRPDLYEKAFLQCPYCHNYTGADTLRSTDSFMIWKKRHEKKVIPTAECRRARRIIHSIIDPLWQRGLIPRKEIYKRLSKATGTNFHNGSLNSREVAQKAIEEANKMKREVAILSGKK